MNNFKIWGQPILRADAYLNATGNDWGMSDGVVAPAFNNGRIRVVHGSGTITDSNNQGVKIMHGTASVSNNCGALMSQYLALHSSATKETVGARKESIQAQMRTILNQMHHIGCGKYSGFTGGEADANILTDGNKTDVYGSVANVSAASGPYYTWCSGAFVQPKVSNTPYSGGITNIWNNPMAPIDAISVSSMDMTTPVGNLSSVPVVNNNVPSCSTTVCTPSPVADNKTVTTTSCVPAAGISDSSTAAPAPKPYVKPTFWEWLKNGMKA